MDNKFKGKIIISLRKLSFQWKPRSNAKNKRKIAPNLFSCEKCNTLVYEGTSENNYTNFVTAYSHKYNVIKGKIHMDHIVPVVNPAIGFTGFDDFIESLFCPEENFQALCGLCHKEKTKREGKKSRGKK